MAKEPYDMNDLQTMFHSEKYMAFYEKTWKENVREYRPDADYVQSLRNRAQKVLYRSPHACFMREHLFEFRDITRYGETHFAWAEEAADKRFDYSEELPQAIAYMIWFVTVCIEIGYRDDSNEFAHDLDNAYGLVEDILAGMLPPEASRRFFRELKYILLAYRIICDPKNKLGEKIDIEYWYGEPENHDPIRHWYRYYIPVNLDLEESSKGQNPTWENILAAKEQIDRVCERKIVCH